MTRDRGLLHIYTGDGKGKTTAALGLAIRAVGAGWKVLFAQFMKKGRFSEINALETFGKQVKILQFGTGSFVRGKPSEIDIQHACQGLDEIRRLIYSEKYDMIVLDEINVALTTGILAEEQVMDVIAEIPAGTEMIMTGRNAPAALLDIADLITECRKIKHYYDRGVAARTGIEK